MHKRALLLASLLFVVGSSLTFAAESITPTPLGVQTQRVAQADAGAAVLMKHNDTLGNILSDGEGRTLYLFTRDERNKSNCSGACLQRWPALLTVGDPKAGEGLDARLLGATKRDDGATQVTYNSWPLYYFAADDKPGDTKGQNVGGIWFVLSAAGRAVGLAPAALPRTGDDLSGSVMGLGAVLGVLLLAGGLWMRRRVAA